MGLLERRAARTFADTMFPSLLGEIHAAAGAEIEIDVRWDELAIPGMSHLYDESWPAVYFRPLISALKEIAADEIGREALQEGLKRVEIRSAEGVIYGDRMATLDDGTLVLDHAPTTNVSNVGERAEGILRELSDSL